MGEAAAQKAVHLILSHIDDWLTNQPSLTHVDRCAPPKKNPKPETEGSLGLQLQAEQRVVELRGASLLRPMRPIRGAQTTTASYLLHLSLL